MEIQQVATPTWVAERTPDPPKTLWVRGDPTALTRLQDPWLAGVAVVGARSPSTYGRAITRSWSHTLAAHDVIIVSGLARGIDAEAHRGALDANGVTIAVLGCGIDRDYPAANTELARMIVESGGCIVSEYEPGVEPAPWRFPARNRIIAGLSSVCLVVEARERSGALITADFAMKCGSDLIAVPGEVTSLLSAGTNRLIREGHARVALEPGDVVGARWHDDEANGSRTILVHLWVEVTGEETRTADELGAYLDDALSVGMEAHEGAEQIRSWTVALAEEI